MLASASEGMDGNCIARLNGHCGGVFSVSDGSFLASVSRDKTCGMAEPGLTCDPEGAITSVKFSVDDSSPSLRHLLTGAVGSQNRQSPCHP